MNKALIQQLLDDKETRRAIAAPFLIGEGSMLDALNKLIDEPVVGDVITIEVSHHMWVRGEYVCAELDGRLLVSIPGKNPGSCVANEEIYAGKRVDMVVKGEEGRGKPDLVGTGVQKGIVAERAKQGESK